MSTIKADNISPVGSILNLTAPVAGLSVASGLTVGGVAYFSGGATFAGVARFAAGVTMSSSLDVNGTLKVSGEITHGSAPVAVPSGTAPVFGARAWVNFNGTSTVAIRSSGNVTSITDNGTGNYTVNFTTAMPDANYAFVGTSSDNDNDSVGPVAVGARSSTYVPTTTGRQFETVYNGTNYDSTFCSVVIFR